MGKARWYTKPNVLQPDTLKYNPNLSHGGINSPDLIENNSDCDPCRNS